MSWTIILRSLICVLLFAANSVLCQDYVPQPKENAIIKFRLKSNVRYQQKTDGTCLLFQKDSGNRAEYICVIDTINSYYTKKLENYFGYHISPMMTTIETRNMWGTFTCYPKMNKKAAVRSEKFDRMIKVRILFLETSGWGPFFLGSRTLSLRVIIKIEEFDGSGKSLSRRKIETIFDEYTKPTFTFNLNGAVFYKGYVLDGNELFSLLFQATESALNTRYSGYNLD